jgi:hypothetical protein
MLQSNFFWITITLLSSIIEWTVLKLILDESSKIKGRKSTVYLCFAVAIITIFFMAKLNFNVFIKLFICMFITFIIYKFNYQTTLLKSVFVSLLYWALIVIFDALSSTIVVSLNSIANIDAVLKETTIRLELIILAKSMLLLVVPIIKVTNKKIDLSKKEFIYAIIPMLSNVASILVLIRYTFEDVPTGNSKIVLIFSMSFMFLLSNISLILVISKIININRLRFKNKLINEKADMQSKHYLNLQKKTFFYELNPEFDTNNSFLDIILTEKKSLCFVSNIKLLVNLDFSKCNFMEASDISSIFSNMIDYLIEECEKMKSKNVTKKIKLSGKDINNNFYILKCESSKVYEIVKNEKDKVTVDNEEVFNDIGINSIKKAVDKYNGELVIEKLGENLSMSILLPLADLQIQY